MSQQDSENTTTKESEDPRPSEKDRTLWKILIRDSAILITLLTCLFFLMGFIYLSEYYSWFGVDVDSLDLPVYASLIASIVTLSWMLNLLRLLIYLCVFACAIQVLGRLFWFRALVGKLSRSFGAAFQKTPAVNPGTKVRVKTQLWSKLSIAFVESSSSNLLLTALPPVMVSPGILFVTALGGIIAGERGKKYAEATYRQPVIRKR